MSSSPKFVVGQKVRAKETIYYLMGQDPSIDKIRRGEVVTIDRIEEHGEEEGGADLQFEEHADRYGPFPANLFSAVRATDRIATPPVKPVKPAVARKSREHPSLLDGPAKPFVVGQRVRAKMTIRYFMGQDPSFDKIRRHEVVTIDRVEVDPNGGCSLQFREHADRYGPFPDNLFTAVRAR